MQGSKKWSQKVQMSERALEDIHDFNVFESKSNQETGNPPPKFEPLSLRLVHRKAYFEWKKQIALGLILSGTTSISQAYTSTAPFKTLKRGSISDLRINVPAKGYYLLLRTIESALKEVAISTIVEDHSGNVFKFAAYNMEDPDFESSPEEIFPCGTVFILKEPFLKTAVHGTHIIRCDSPTDIIIIEEHHELYALVKNTNWQHQIFSEDAEPKATCTSEWKSLGNSFFQQKRYRKALGAYLSALKCNNTEDTNMSTVLYTNIAAAYLKMGYFESTLTFAQKALGNDSKNAKALYRIGCAHYELRQFKEAKLSFDKILQYDSNNKDASKESARCSERLNEADGNISIYKLHLTNKLKPKSLIDIADHIGPLEVVQIPGKGRGFCATESIKPGKLLLVSKAIRASFKNDNEFLVQEDLTKVNHFNHGENVHLVAKIAQAVTKNPNTFGKLVYGLTSNVQTLDQENKLFCDNDSKEEPIADVDRIRKILNTNCFGLQTTNEMAQGKYSALGGSGLFIEPSFMNHSCMFNASWEVYNDVMVIFAVKPIECGEEVYISYVDVLKSFLEREERFQRNWSFKCTCLLCEQDRLDGFQINEKRKDLSLKLETLPPEIGMSSEVELRKRVKDRKMLANAMEATYLKSTSPLPRYHLFIFYVKLALTLMKYGEIDEMKATLEKALKSIGLDYKGFLALADTRNTQVSFKKDVLINYLLPHIPNLFICGFEHFNRTQEAKRWLRVLVNLEKILCGGNVEMVKAKFTNIPKYLFSYIKNN